jgi:hypothetical protein
MRKKIKNGCCPIASLAGQSHCLGSDCAWFDAQNTGCLVIDGIRCSIAAIGLLRKDLDELSRGDS